MKIRAAWALLQKQRGVNHLLLKIQWSKPLKSGPIITRHPGSILTRHLGSILTCHPGSILTHHPGSILTRHHTIFISTVPRWTCSYALLLMIRLHNYDQINQLPPLLLNYDHYYNYNLLITKISCFTTISLYYNCTFGNKYCDARGSELKSRL